VDCETNGLGGSGVQKQFRSVKIDPSCDRVRKMPELTLHQILHINSTLVPNQQVLIGRKRPDKLADAANQVLRVTRGGLASNHPYETENVLGVRWRASRISSSIPFLISAIGSARNAWCSEPEGAWADVAPGSRDAPRRFRIASHARLSQRHPKTCTQQQQMQTPRQPSHTHTRGCSFVPNAGSRTQ
jgi:hypothetical protein